MTKDITLVRELSSIVLDDEKSSVMKENTTWVGNKLNLIYGIFCQIMFVVALALMFAKGENWAVRVILFYSAVILYMISMMYLSDFNSERRFLKLWSDDSIRKIEGSIEGGYKIRKKKEDICYYLYFIDKDKSCISGYLQVPKDYYYCNDSDYSWYLYFSEGNMLDPSGALLVRKEK